MLTSMQTVLDGPAPQPPTQAVEPQSRDAGDTDHVAWLLTAARGRDWDTHRYRLLLRFMAINLVAFGLLGAAYLHGYVGLVLASDQTYLSIAIFAVFVGGFGLCAGLVTETSREINHVRDFDPLCPSRAADYLAAVRGRSASSRAISGATLRLKLSTRIGVVRHIANSLVLLGLIGTVIGFIIALSGVDPQRASDVSAIAPMVSTLIDGMSVALYTTLVGAVFNLWLMVNYHILAGGTVKLISAIVEIGERHANA
jgi:hypothetical protein